MLGENLKHTQMRLGKIKTISMECKIRISPGLDYQNKLQNL